MGNLWLKVKIWSKVALSGLLFLYVIVFVANNSAKSVSPWFWYQREPQTTLLRLVLYAFLTGVVCTVLVSTTFKTLRQVRDLRIRNRTGRLEREVADMKTKAGMLRSRGEEESGEEGVGGGESEAR